MTSRAGERAAVAALVATTLLWGGTFVAIRDAVVLIAPATLVFVRFSAATLIFALALLVRRKPVVRRDVLGGMAAGAFMLGGFFLQAWGLRSTSAGTSAFLTCAGTLFAGFVAWPLLGQRPRASLVAGIALALAGSALLSLRGGLALGRGELITLAGALMFALQIVTLARVTPGADALTIAFAQSLTAAIALSFRASDGLHVLGTLGGANALRLGYLVLAGSVIAPLLHVIAQGKLSAGRVGLLLALEPVFALVFALSIGAERFEPRWWAGAALILIAVLLVEWRAAATTPPTASR